MAFKVGHKKTGGRKKGTPNKKTQDLAERMESLGVDPFEILLFFAKGDWKALGYPEATRTYFTAAGIEAEEEIIKPELRMHAAKEACQYVLPKRKATEMTVVDEAKMKEIERMSELSDADLEAELKRMGFERVKQ